MSEPADDADVAMCIGFALQQSGALKRRDRLDEPHRHVAERVLKHLKLSGFAVVRERAIPIVTPSDVSRKPT